MRNPLDKDELFEVLGSLSNPQVALQYDVQVPQHKRAEFEKKYVEVTGGLTPHSPGYSVLGAGVDKRSV